MAPIIPMLLKYVIFKGIYFWFHNGLQIYDDVQKFPVGGATCTVCSQLVESSG